MLWLALALPLLAPALFWLWNRKLQRDYRAQFDQATAMFNAAKYSQAVQAFGRAYRTAASIRLHRNDTDVRALINLSISLQKLGRKEEALRCASGCFAISRQREDRTGYSLRLYSLLADLLEENGAVQKSVGFRQVAANLLRKVKGADSMLLAEQLYKLGLALGKAGLPEHSSRAVAEAVAIASHHLPGQNQNYAAYLTSLGTALKKTGERDRAERVLQEALSLQRALFGEKDVRIVPALNNLGSLYSEWGRYDDATRVYEEAYRIRVQAFGESDARVGLVLNNYANCLRRAGRLEEARQAAERAVKLVEMHQHNSLANALGTLAHVLLAEQDYQGAASAYERAQTASLTGPTSSTLLDSVERLEHHAQALDHLQRAVEADSLRLRAAQIRSSLAEAPPAAELLQPQLGEFLRTTAWLPALEG